MLLTAARSGALVALVASIVLALGGCHVQRRYPPTAVPAAALAKPVELYLGRPMPLSWTTRRRWPRADSVALHEPAARVIVGHVRPSGADSLEIQPQHVYGERGWQPAAGAPAVRLALGDVTRVEQRQASGTRTAVLLLVVVGGLVWLVADALDSMDDFYRGSN